MLWDSEEPFMKQVQMETLNEKEVVFCKNFEQAVEITESHQGKHKNFRVKIYKLHHEQNVI